VKDIAVMSGKGGTGKTSIAAALGVVAGDRAVMVDCDVDAANLHLLYEPRHLQEHEFWSGKKAVIDYDLCTDCGVCFEKCRFDAIDAVDGAAAKSTRYVIDTLSCEGCAVCHHLCPVEAISMKDEMAGEWFVSKSRFGHWFVHARLGIGQENSGKLVSKVKDEARKLAGRENIPYVIVDGPPGVGCPVIAAFSGVDRVLIVTEATLSGMHDMERLVELARQFNAPHGNGR
jgi:MinD superfamily P-loop ATPase